VSPVSLVAAPHQAVLQNYRGELVAGCSWAWLAGPRETVRTLVLDAYTGLTEHLSQPTTAAAA
jgi:hypothetical protein